MKRVMLSISMDRTEYEMQPRNPRFIWNIIKLIELAALVCMLTACIPEKYHIPKERLDDVLQKHLPFQFVKGPILVTTVGVPLLSLITEQNRVSVGTDFEVKASKLELEGHVIFSSSLRYDPEQRAIFFSEARIDSVQTRNGKVLPELARSLVDRLVSDSMTRKPIYRFRPSELVVLGTEIEVESIEVVPDGILLKLRAVR